MRLALYEPDIPQNTGTILRLAACMGMTVDLIGPAGFDMTDRALKRAGLDYLEHVTLVRHAGFCCLRGRTPHARLAPRPADDPCRYPLHRLRVPRRDTLLLGRESAGVPESVHARRRPPAHSHAAGTALAQCGGRGRHGAGRGPAANRPSF